MVMVCLLSLIRKPIEGFWERKSIFNKTGMIYFFLSFRHPPPSHILVFFQTRFFLMKK